MRQGVAGERCGRGNDSRQQGVLEKGDLSFIDSSVDMKTGIMSSRACSAIRTASLWPGQFVDANLILNERPAPSWCRRQAMQTGADGSYVFVVDHEMKVQSRPVVGRLPRTTDRLSVETRPDRRRDGGDRRPIAAGAGREGLDQDTESRAAAGVAS